ncbi:meiotic recombination protein REC114 isoform X2 [Thalassophryne amazonica]|uniref:meiotic recombination protein REC114 isoform X2 n=1 Tax=Thalassophryne amazonica TaxID=390379 RepID=UPI001470AC09|nr:meiotic recombination protein REC114 isoform X2 [Thalassophryne amazonica]
MATSQTWKLKRFGRLIPSSRGKATTPWKVIEAKDSQPGIILTIAESGHLMVLQGHECLDVIFLLVGSDFLKVHQKADNLMLRCTLEGESRMIRVQFAGRSRAEAIKQCSSAVNKLKEYVPVSIQNDSAQSLNQPPSEITAPLRQTMRREDMGAEPDVVQGQVSIKRLTQCFLGECSATLPLTYHYCSLPEDDLEQFLRVCLLDPSFHGFVEQVEREFRKLLHD